MTEPVDAAAEWMARATSTEPFHPDLLPWMVEGPFGPALKHPLVVDVLGPRPGIVNYAYEVKRKMLDEGIEEGNWYRVIFLYERPYRLDALLTYRERIEDPETWWRLVASVWTDSENIHENLDSWREVFVDEHPERRFLMSGDDHLDLFTRPDKFTVYRGCQEGVNEEGMSWTLSRERAMWFARRWAIDETPLLLTGTVMRDDVIALFHGRGESEIVVLPEDVTVTRRRRIGHEKGEPS